MKVKSDKSVNLRVPKDLYNKFQEKCEEDGESVANVIKKFMRREDELYSKEEKCEDKWHYIDLKTKEGFNSIPKGEFLYFTNCSNPNKFEIDSVPFPTDGPCNIVGDIICRHGSTNGGVVLGCMTVDLRSADFPYTFWSRINIPKYETVAHKDIYDRNNAKIEIGKMAIAVPSCGQWVVGLIDRIEYECFTDASVGVYIKNAPNHSPFGILTTPESITMMPLLDPKHY